METREFNVLTSKYVISPIDGKKYCRKNGQFKKHLISSGFNTYQEFFDRYFPNDTRLCVCGNKCSFKNNKMEYLRSCGNRECVGKVVSEVKQSFSEEQWNNQRVRFRASQSRKSKEELQQIQRQRIKTALLNNSYKKSVKKRENTCRERHGNAKYNNNKQISSTKLNWSEERKQLFLQRLRESLDGKKLSDFWTEETWLKNLTTRELHGYRTPDNQLSDWLRYKRTVRKLTEQTYRQFKDKINLDNKPRSRCGVSGGYQLDHVIPIFWGFKNGVPEDVMSSIENLQMLPWEENLQKWHNYEPTCSE